MIPTSTTIESQFVQDLVRPKFLQNQFESSSHDSINLKLDKSDIPIFSKSKISLNIPNYSAGDFIHLAISKNWLVCVVTANQVKLLRFFLHKDMTQGEINLERHLSGYKVGKLFLDPCGYHTLITLIPTSRGLSADFLYIHGNGPKVRRIEKFKDYEITAVAFNKYQGNETSTGTILLGTNKGVIFETELSVDNDKLSYKKQIYDLGLGRTKYPITALELLLVSNANNHYLIIATTPDSIFTFQDTIRPDEKTFQGIFNNYINGTRMQGFQTAKTDLNYSVLGFYTEPNSKYPLNWGWLCGSGLRYGQVIKESITSEKFLTGEEIIPFEKNIEERKHLSYEERHMNVPKTFIISKYHVIFMYTDHIRGICLLNQKTVYEEYFHEEDGRLLNMIRDPFTGLIYVYSVKSLFVIKIQHEKRHIWKIYLSQGLYDLAQMHANDETQINTIMIKKANAAFNAGNFFEAAQLYANTNKTFTDICLKFIDLQNKQPIIIYLKTRLLNLGKQNIQKENMHTRHNFNEDEISILISWLIDMYLTEINFPGRSEDEKLAWQADYDEFMRQFVVLKYVRTHHENIQKLIIQHADTHNLAQFAIASEDYEQVIEQHLLEEKYFNALRILHKQKDTNLYYKYCPILIEYMPRETIEILKAQGRNLDIKKLVPTLINIDTSLHVSEIIKYIEYCIHTLGETNKSIHNYMVSLYAEYQSKMVIKYLESEGTDLSLIHYDINYCLYVCLKFHIREACVFLYSIIELWYDAVELALEFDIKLAKDIASKPSNDDTKRELWLRIAQHEIQDTNDVKKTLDLINDCKLLKIEDLLPFFSDFEKINDFKEPICKALKEYNQQIQEIQHDMQECAEQSDKVRNDLQNIRERCIRLDVTELCSKCDGNLMVKTFFVFNCSHKFHTDCLEKIVIPQLNSDQCRKLTMLKHQLETVLHPTQIHAINSTEEIKNVRTKRKQLKNEIEDILAADCPYCCLMIETIDLPFVINWDQVRVDWD